MKKLSTLVLVSSISALSGNVSAGPIDGAVSALGLGGVLSTSTGLPSQVNAGLRGLSSQAPGGGRSPMVGVSVFEYNDRLNAEFVGVAIGSGDRTGNANSGVGVAVLSGQDSGNGGAVGVGVLSEGGSGGGGIVSVRALNADEALALGLGGSDVFSEGPGMQSGMSPLSGARLNQPLRDALGHDRGLGGEIDQGFQNVADNAQTLALNDEYVDVSLFGGDDSSSDGLVGVAAISGDRSGSNNLVGAAAMSGRDSGNNGTINTAALSDEDSGNGGWVNLAALNSGETGQASGAMVNVSVINDTQSEGGVVAIAVANGVPGGSTSPLPSPENPNTHTAERGAGKAGSDGCAIDSQQFENGLPGETGPQLASRFAKPVAPHSADGCELPDEMNLASSN